MRIKIAPLSPQYEHLYAKFLAEHPAALFYHTLKYRDFLKKILSSTQDIYLLALQENEIIGIFPMFINHLDGEYSLINSLPFFGSHGGILISPRVRNREFVMNFFIEELLRICKEEKCISFTIIDGLIDPQSQFYENKLKMLPTDFRVGQITPLQINNKNTLEEELMEKFHSKTRNVVRKSIKSQFSWETNNTLEGLTALYQLHSANMNTIGGKEKPLKVFEAIFQHFEAGKDYNIYFAKKNNDIAAGLLLFYYKDWCEYYTPVINPLYRGDQPLSFLIFMAMKEVCGKGLKYWNWGGTWSTQKGVYLFKKRWGAMDYGYNYYTKIINPEQINKKLDRYIQEAPYFYIKNYRSTDDIPA
jgi:Acetyltransferase (GNAT) domain